jgi:hypothetical protein
VTEIPNIAHSDEIEWFCEKCGAIMPEDYFVMVDEMPYFPSCVTKE